MMLKRLVLLLSAASIHAAGSFQWYCTMNGPVYEVVKDLSTREIFFANGTREDSMLGRSVHGRRRLSAPLLAYTQEAKFKVLRRGEKTSSQDARSISIRRTADESPEMSQIMLMKECRCMGTSDTYCPAYLSSCGISRISEKDQAHGCVTTSSNRRHFARSVLLAVVVAYALIAACLFTKWGKNVIGFFANYVFCGWNVYFANRMMIRDPARANELIRHHLRLRRRMLQRRYRAIMGPEALVREQSARAAAAELQIATENSPTPSSLALKTRIHHIFIVEEELLVSEPTKSGDDEDELDDETCTICFGALEEGDRVGDLSCKHTFHAQCLKSWLSRRNVCPLCQEPGVATPRFGVPTVPSAAHPTRVASEVI
jgi:hypothetical protein